MIASAAEQAEVDIQAAESTPSLARSLTPVADLFAHVAEWRERHPENHESSFAIIDRLAWQHGVPLARDRAHRIYIEVWDVIGCPQEHDDIVGALLATAVQARDDGE